MANRGSADDWLARYGNQVSAEWAFPKIVEVLKENEDLYNEAAYFVEAGDWVIWNLTGERKRSSCMMGYKYFWNGDFPDRDFFEAVDPRLANIVETKLAGEILPTGSFAGRLTKEAAQRLGLAEGTAVATAIIDAHAALPALGLVGPGKMLMIMGTSTCHIIMDAEEHLVPGISGVVKDGIVPGLYAYEAGQSAVGDIFAWFVENCVPKACHDEAEAREMSIHALMEEKAQALPPGGAGVVALDWWNGNRSILSNTELSGAIFGLTLSTKPEEIYRALLEACAYGTRKIIESFEECGVAVTELYACGGIAIKDPLMMQIYSDVTGRAIRVAANTQAAAVGAAIFGASAAGLFPSLYDAASVMGRVREDAYTPDPHARAVYDKLYREYSTLHDYFGRGANEVMHRLREM